MLSPERFVFPCSLFASLVFCLFAHSFFCLRPLFSCVLLLCFRLKAAAGADGEASGGSGSIEVHDDLCVGTIFARFAPLMAIYSDYESRDERTAGAPV